MINDNDTDDIPLYTCQVATTIWRLQLDPSKIFGSES